MSNSVTESRLEEKLQEESIVNRRAKFPYKIGVFGLYTIYGYCHGARIPTPNIPLYLPPAIALGISTAASTVDYALASRRQTKAIKIMGQWALQGAKKGLIDGARAAAITAAVGYTIGYIFGAMERG